MTAIEYYWELLVIDCYRLLPTMVGCCYVMDYRLLLVAAVYYRLNVNFMCRECCLVVVLCCVLFCKWYLTGSSASSRT
jgi:hypothetical protein